MSKVTPDAQLVSAAEAAKILGCHSRTIRRMVADGHLLPRAKAPGPRGAYLFDRADILALKASA